MTDGFGSPPIALFNFNRPRLTRRLFDVIKLIKPTHLLLIADGPRSSRPTDIALCAEVRAIFDEIDWECKVSRNFSETNMGSFRRNSSGLNWVFDTVEEAIILEDDCIPSLSFFPYCQELLARYRDNANVAVISGNNFGFSGKGRKDDSYFFSGYALTWGWASWRRAWEKVDMDMTWWKKESERAYLRKALPHKQEWRYWSGLCKHVESGKRSNAWDYQLVFSLFRSAQYCAFPRVNLVSNEGYGGDSTHCFNDLSRPVFDLEFPLSHPAQIQISAKVDHALFQARICPPLLIRIKNKLISLFWRFQRKFLT